MEKIRQILQDVRPEIDFKQSNDFIADGYLDSFDVVTIVAEIEEIFRIKIDGLDIIPENFKSIEAMMILVDKNGGKV